MKALLALFLCFSFLGFSETSQAGFVEKIRETFSKVFGQENEHKDLYKCNGKLTNHPDGLEFRDHYNECTLVNEQEYRELCDEGDFDACIDLGDWEDRRGNYEAAAAIYAKTCDEGNFSACNLLEVMEQEKGNNEADWLLSENPVMKETLKEVIDLDF